MFGLYTHGEERERKFVVDNGKMTYIRREKYCVKHGWIDCFRIGGNEAWHSQHDRCNHVAHDGAFVVPKAMGAAA